MVSVYHRQPLLPDRTFCTIHFHLELADLLVELGDKDFFVSVLLVAASLIWGAPSSRAPFQALIWLGWTSNLLASSAVVWTPFMAARATLALKDGLCFLRSCFMSCSLCCLF